MRLLRGGPKRRVASLAQVLQQIDFLCAKSQRITYLLGYRSNDISRTFRRAVLICNSVAIVLLQFGLLPAALKVLKKGLKLDILLFYEGSPEDRRWFQRALVYSNLGYLMQRIGDYQASLKFLLDAESLVAEADETSATQDLTLAHAMLSFMVLFRIHKYDLAKKYLQLATNEYNGVVGQRRKTRFNAVALANLYCLLTLSAEVLKEDDDNSREGIKTLLTQPAIESTAAASLLEQYAHASSRENGIYLVLSEEFQHMLFVSCFFPFISPKTPLLSLNDLTRAQGFPQSVHLGRAKDAYSAILRDALLGRSN